MFVLEHNLLCRSAIFMLKIYANSHILQHSEDKNILLNAISSERMMIHDAAARRSYNKYHVGCHGHDL